MEVPIGLLVKKHVYIRHQQQPIVYEGADFLCVKCGVPGHTQLIVLPILKNLKIQAQKIQLYQRRRMWQQAIHQGNNQKHHGKQSYS